MESFAEIFAGNALTLGLVCVEATQEQIAEIAAAVEEVPATVLTIDVEAQTMGSGSRIGP